MKNLFVFMMFVLVTASAATALADAPRVTAAAVARNVVDRLPEGAGDTFGLDAGTLWAHATLENVGDPTHIKMVWKQGDKTRFTATLKVGKGKVWRTWSRHRVARGDVGPWTVEVQDEAGALLQTLSFKIDA